MSANTPSVSPDSDCLSAIEIMRETGAACLPVVDEGHLVGVVSEGDILRGVPLTSTMGSVAPDPATILSVVRVAGIMAYGPATVEDTAPMAEALQLMARSGASAIPVLHQGRLVGMFTVPNALHGALEILRLETLARSEEVEK